MLESSGLNHEHHSPEPGDAVSVFIDSGAPLPETYGDNILVILPRDPHTMFVYWDVQPSRFDPLRHEWGSQLDQASLVLRVFDITDGVAHPPFFDVDIDVRARQWYVRIPHSGRNYKVELGYRLPNGTFIGILASNTILLPNGVVSDQIDAQWMNVRPTEEYWEKILHNVDLGRGSADFSRQMAQRWQFLKSVFSMGMPPSSFTQMPGSMPGSLPNSGAHHE